MPDRRMKLVLEDGTEAGGIAFGEALPVAGEVVFNTAMTGHVETLTTGPFNMQFLAKRNDVKVVGCNVRASRCFPFVSEVAGNNHVVGAMRRMLGVRRPVANHSPDLEFVAVKVPMFSFSRPVGADAVLVSKRAVPARPGASGTTSTRPSCMRSSRQVLGNRSGALAIARTVAGEVLVCRRGTCHRRGARTSDLRNGWHGRSPARIGHYRYTPREARWSR